MFRAPLLAFLTCRVTLLFSYKSEWLVPCDTPIRATGGPHNMWILVNVAILVLATLIAGAAAVVPWADKATATSLGRACAG